MPFSSCDKYKRKTKQRRRRCTTHIKQHRSKRVQPNGSPCANNHCSTRYEQSFRHNKHTHTNQKAATDKHSSAQSLSSSQTTSRDAKPTQHIEITHQNNVNLKLAFHKVASFHPHYSTFTPQDLPPPSAPGSGHGLRRRHHNHIHTHKYECSQEIHTTIPT